MVAIQSLANQVGQAAGLPVPRTEDLLRPTSVSPDSNARIERSARDFESILLGNWLQHAEDTFARVPGSETDDNDDDGTGQMQQSLAMQPFATALTASGGIGIAAMIARQLYKSQAASEAPDAATQTGSKPPP